MARLAVGAGERDRRRKPARDLGREARAGEDGGDRRRKGFCQHVGQELQRSLLDALGADEHGRSGPDAFGEAGADRAHVLGGGDEKQSVGPGGVLERGRGADRLLERYVRQEEAVLAGPVDGLDNLGLTGPKRHPARAVASPGRDLSQCGAPGAAADDADVFELPHVSGIALIIPDCAR